MWKNIKNTNLFIKFCKDYEIFVTDFVNLWYSYFTKTSFLSCLKESNKLLEMADDTLIQKGLHVLSNTANIKSADHKIDNKSLIVSMTMLFGYPFKVCLTLCEGSKELFFLKVTQPLLKTISELKSSQSELCELLIKKDSEIEEYKRMGGEIAIKYLKTKPFDDGAFLSKYQMYQEYFGSTDNTVHSLLNVKLDVPEDVTNVKIESHEEPSRPVIKEEPIIKMEPEFQMTEEIMPTLSSLENVKQEIESPIKRESQASIPSNNRKRMKKLNL